MLVRESISFERYKDPRRALFGEKFGDNDEEVSYNLQKQIKAIIHDPLWKGELEDVHAVYYNQHSDRPIFKKSKISAIEVWLLYQRDRSYGKEIKQILNQLGITIIGPMIKSSFGVYIFPVKSIY